jgi:imidazolonepropionase-like amidohydrolase
MTFTEPDQRDSSAQLRRTILRGAKLFQNGREVESDVAFTSHIVEIGKDLRGDRFIEARECVILPGLVDAHLHIMSGEPGRPSLLNTQLSLQFFQAMSVLWATLKGGVTYARDASGADPGIREAVSKGLVKGPRLKVAIRIMHTTGSHGDSYVDSGQSLRPFPPYPGSPDTLFDGPYEARVRARELVRAGADVLKVAVTGGIFQGRRKNALKICIRHDELEEIVTVARCAGIPVMAHAHSAEGAAMAAEAGVTSVEHGTFLDQDAAKVMARCGTILVPTLLASQRTEERNRERHHGLLERHLSSLQTALDAGVRVAAGTDAGVAPHGKLLAELDLMRNAGMDANSVVESATLTGAQLLGVEDHHGEIRVGALADFVILTGELRYGDLDGRIRQVWQGGVPVINDQPMSHAGTR